MKVVPLKITVLTQIAVLVPIKVRMPTMIYRCYE